MKINILQGAFLPVPPVRGGAIESAWQLLAEEFVKFGHVVDYYSRRCDGLKGDEYLNGVHHIRLKSTDAVKSPFFLKTLELPYVLRAKKLMQKADILVTHAFWAPILFHPYKYGKLYVHVGRYPKGQLNLYEKANRLQTPSQAIAEVSRNQTTSQSHKIKALPYPLPWDVISKLEYHHKKNIILYAGRIHPEKGILELIEAWKNIHESLAHNYELRLIGPWKEKEGGAGKSFRDRIELEIGHIRNKIKILDPIFDRKKLKSQIIESKFFIYPSKAERGETFGLSVLEAMSCGTVPIVSSLACFKDFLEFPEHAYCIKPIEGKTFSKDIAKSISQALSDDSSEIEIKSKACWHKAKQYEIAEVAKLYINDFQSLLLETDSAVI